MIRKAAKTNTTPRFLAASVLLLGCGAARLATAQRDEAQVSGSRSEHAPRKQFFVDHDRDSDRDDARQYCEDIIRKTGVAQLARSRDSADYVIVPSMDFERRISRKDHTKTVKHEYYNDKGEKKTKEETKVAHRDDVLTVTTRFDCRILRPDRDGDAREVWHISGHNDRSTRGPDTPGHDADDSPIHIYRDEVPRLSANMIRLEGNTGEGALYKIIFGLCNVHGPVTDVDTKANRVTVLLGLDDGVQPKDYPGGVSELEIYAQTQRLAAYTYRDPFTGKLFTVSKASAEARPDSPDTWAYTQSDALPIETRATLTGPEAKALEPLGEKVCDWAEVVDVQADRCTAALKKKGDYGRTVDDLKTLQRLPDPHMTPLIARIRVKRGMVSR